MRKKKISKTPKSPPPQANIDLRPSELPHEPVVPRRVPPDFEALPHQGTQAPDDVAFWSTKAGRPITAADLHEIDGNVVPLVELLVAIRARQQPMNGRAPHVPAEGTNGD